MVEDYCNKKNQLNHEIYKHLKPQADRAFLLLRGVNRLERIGCGVIRRLGSMTGQLIRECFSLRSVDSWDRSLRRVWLFTFHSQGWAKAQVLGEERSLTKIWSSPGIDQPEWSMGTNSCANYLWVRNLEGLWAGLVIGYKGWPVNFIKAIWRRVVLCSKLFPEYKR